jgi:hypothetical protein
MKQILLLLLLSTAIFTSCKKHDLQPEGVFKGAEVQMYDGKAYTWFKTDKFGLPSQLAISITDDAMNSLPSDIKGDPAKNAFILPQHPRSAITPFDHGYLEWNPFGHPPPGIFDVPHFDYHFYMTDAEEQLSIPAYEVDSTGFQKYPAAPYLPSTYVPIPGGVPAMGKHWFDATSPEFNGQPFTQTFIYGTYNSKVTFYEPMITRAFLKDNDSFVRSIPQPEQFRKPGYYPTQLRIRKHDGVTDVILEGFVFRH